MHISLPNLSLVVLIGPSGAGKSTFARRHFLGSEILSSDTFRAMLCDDENNQGVTNEAFALLHQVAAARLALGRLTVVDATNVQLDARRPLIELAKRYHCLPVAIVLNLPEDLCHARNRIRTDRSFGSHVVRNQRAQLKRSLGGLQREGFRKVFELTTVEQVEAAVIERVPLWNDRSEERGPFDIIGDVHGCADELEQLLERLGYVRTAVAEVEPGWSSDSYAHPEGRKVVFVGDLVDRGPRVLDTLRLVRNMVRNGAALCVPGNHDMKLQRKLSGKNVQVRHGLAETLAELERLPDEVRPLFATSLAAFLDGLVSHYVLDRGNLVVAHAGMKAEMQGRASGAVRNFALFGETTGETDEFGLPVRYNWAAEYRGRAMVVYGHTPVPEPLWLNNTVNVDTGCVFGGKLTALRYPEKETVSVPAARIYCEPSRPFLSRNDGVAEVSQRTSQQVDDDVLDADDVQGKRLISTRLRGPVRIGEAQARAALEVMSRFAANPKWLIYLPPTMSPSETASEPGWLEYPTEAFAYFRGQGATRVLCEEKHMGSRAVVIVCRDEQAARARFGVLEGETGIVTTRTGRRFFHEAALEAAFLDRVRTALTRAELWNRLDTTWVCIDAELMPWSAKAQELLVTQYAAVGAAGREALPPVIASLSRAAERLAGDERANAERVLSQTRRREEHVTKFVTAYRHYCWPVQSLADLKLAPFHLLASEGRVHSDKPHTWHMETLAALCACDPELLVATRTQVVDVTDPESVAKGTAWWLELTERGGEGMVVKPLNFVLQGKRGLAQPAVKCRGREYLRIIYGPDYTAEENLRRLRVRGLGAKRALALGEFALGLEGLERFVHGEPLRRVHECVFGVLALESEAVDPRL